MVTQHSGSRRGVFKPRRGLSLSRHLQSALKRYLLIMIGPGNDTRFAGGFGVYDAPEPWGPWTTVFYTDALGRWAGRIGLFTVQMVQPPTDASAWLVFSDDDSFSVRRATLELVSDWQTTRIPVKRGDSN